MNRYLSLQNMTIKKFRQLAKIILPTGLPSERPSKSYMFKIVRRFIFDAIKSIPDAYVLDAACQTGWHIGYLFPNGIEYHGIDIDPGVIEVAKNNHSEKNFYVLPLKTLEEQFPAKYFDLIVSTNTLEYLTEEDIAGAVESMVILLKIKGSLVVTINDVHPDTDRLYFRELETRLKAKFQNISRLSYNFNQSAKVEKKYQDARGWYVNNSTKKSVYIEWLVAYLGEHTKFGPSRGTILLCRGRR
jgi:SAM-dependent methyltransferase